MSDISYGTSKEFVNNFNPLRVQFGKFFINYEFWVRDFIEDKPFEELSGFYHELEAMKEEIDVMVRPLREIQGAEQNHQKQQEIKVVINSVVFPAQALMYSLQNLFSCLQRKNQNDGKIKPPV
ncbi:MAG: hypothetical protein Q8Q06_03155 [bacterium]|nr:hypothetical protein [bacterium]